MLGPSGVNTQAIVPLVNSSSTSTSQLALPVNEGAMKLAARVIASGNNQLAEQQRTIALAEAFHMQVRRGISQLSAENERLRGELALSESQNQQLILSFDLERVALQEELDVATKENETLRQQMLIETQEMEAKLKAAEAEKVEAVNNFYRREGNPQLELMRSVSAKTRELTLSQIASEAAAKTAAALREKEAEIEALSQQKARAAQQAEAGVNAARAEKEKVLTEKDAQIAALRLQLEAATKELAQIV